MGLMKLTAIGNVGNDPEAKTIGNGTFVLNFSVGVNMTRSEKGQKVKITHWLRCAMFGKRAETLAPMLHKGKQVYVEGTLNPRLYPDNSGTMKLSLDLDVSDLQLLGSKDDAHGDGGGGGQQQQAPRQRQQNAPRNAPAQEEPPADDGGGYGGDDDIPFISCEFVFALEGFVLDDDAFDVPHR